MPNFSIVVLSVVHLCEYTCIFAVDFPLYVPKMGILRFLRVQMWKYCILTPKDTSHSTFLSYSTWTSVNGYDLYAITRKRYIKSLRCYILPLSPEAPVELIFTKVDMGVYLPDVILHSQFHINQLKGFDSVMGRISPFPIGKPGRR